MQDVQFNWSSDESKILKSLKLVEYIQFSLEQYRKTVLSHHVPCSGRCTQLENAENAMKQLQTLLSPIQSKVISGGIDFSEVCKNSYGPSGKPVSVR